MKILATIACGLHFVAVLLTSGVALCVGNDGHADYEWTEQRCCGETALAAAEQERCCGETGDHVAAAPECGGCVDGLAPLAGGIQIGMDHVFAAPVETGRVELTEACAADECPVAGEPAMARPPMPLPLRC